MSDDTVVGQLDLTLTDEIVRNVEATGESFRKEIWNDGDGSRGLLGYLVVDKSETSGVRLRISVLNSGNNSNEAPDNAEPGKEAPSIVTPGKGATGNEVPSTAAPGNEVASTATPEVPSIAIPIAAAETTDGSVQAVQPTGESFMQTDVMEQDTQSSQTEKKKQENQTSQTHKAITQETHMQTDIKKYAEGASQTRVFEVCEHHVQTEPKEEAEKDVQTDEKPLSDGMMQTEAAAIGERAMQTQPASGVGTHQQTDPTPIANIRIQTDPTPLSEAIMQTDPTPLGDKNIQVQADMTEQHMQTVYMGDEKEVQTVLLTEMRSTQTIIKQFSDTDVQTENRGVDAIMQTSREFMQDIMCETEPMIVIDPEEQFEMDTQTDHVRVIDPHQEIPNAAQTDPVKIIYPEFMRASNIQTDFVRVIDPNCETEIATQTDEVHIRDPRYQLEVETQTDPISSDSEKKEMVEQDSQTTLVWVVSLQQRQDEEEAEERVISASEPQAEAPPPQAEAPPPQLEPAPVDNLPEGAPIDAPPIDQEAEKENVHGTLAKPGYTVLEEKFVQTDPVTIIIGDSSFLVKKLERYANKEPNVRMLDSARRGRGRVATRGGRLLSRPMPPAPAHLLAGMTGLEDGPPELMPEEMPPGLTDESREMPVLDAEDEAKQEQKPLEIKPEYAPPAPMRQTPTVRQRGGHRAGPARHYTHVRPKPLDKKDLCPESKKGRFNCPFCTLMFSESALLYKHLQATHGTPRASNRRARRKGTIIITPDGQRIVENGGLARKPVPPRRSYELLQMSSPKEQALIGEEEFQPVEQEAQVGVVENGSVSQEMMDVIETPLLGRRAFSCPFCPKTFTKSSALYVHLQNSHKAEKNRMRSPRSGTSRYKIVASGQPLEGDGEQGVIEEQVYDPQYEEQQYEEPAFEDQTYEEEYEEVIQQEVTPQEYEQVEQVEPEAEVVHEEVEQEKSYQEEGEEEVEVYPQEEVEQVEETEVAPPDLEEGDEEESFAVAEEGVEEQVYIGEEIKEEEDPEIKREDDEQVKKPRGRGRPPGKRKRVETGSEQAVVPKKRKSREADASPPIDSIAARRSRRSSGAAETEQRKKPARTPTKTTSPPTRGRGRPKKIVNT